MKVGVNSRIYSSEFTGIQNYIRGLYNAISKIDSNNKYTFFQMSKEKKLGKTLTTSLPKNKLSNVLFDLFLVSKHIRNSGVSVFHGAANVLPFNRMGGVKYVVTIHDLFVMIDPAMALKLHGQFYYRAVLKRTIKNADLIIVYSESTRKDVIKFFNINPNKVKLIYAGVDEYYFSVKSPRRLIKDNYFFTAMTHPTRKNTARVLDAFSKVPDLKKYKLVVAGPDHIIEKLTETAINLGLEKNLVLFGVADKKQMASLYSHAQFFVFPSLYEGFGFPVLEAMLCGCPVITSNCSSLVEVTPDSNWLVTPDSIDQIAKKMENLVDLDNNKLKLLIKKNRSFAEKFTWEAAARETVKTFEKLSRLS